MVNARKTRLPSDRGCGGHLGRRHSGPGTAASANKDYGSLTARWWKWVYAQKAVDVGGTNTNPVLDSTGAYANVGQAHGIGPDNKYFFLTGTFGASVTRTVTVPKGKALFFPIINASVDNAVDPPTHYGVPKLKALAKASIDTAIVDHLSAAFDGQNVPFFRSTAPTFDYTLPKNHSIYAYFGLFGPQFEGRVKPAVADGYWAFLAPPSAGPHTLTFHAENTQGFNITVVYNLTIG